jgi:hypothetical protein
VLITQEIAGITTIFAFGTTYIVYVVAIGGVCGDVKKSLFANETVTWIPQLFITCSKLNVYWELDNSIL